MDGNRILNNKIAMAVRDATPFINSYIQLFGTVVARPGKRRAGKEKIPEL